MADLTVADVRARFSEFGAAAFPAALVSDLIAEAYSITDVSREATLYCVAHLLSLEEQNHARPDGGSGEVVTETTGPFTANFRSQADSGRDVFFSTTPYGRRVMTLERRSPKAVMGILVR